MLDGNAKVIDISGADNTNAFIHGAYAVLNLLNQNNITYCYLKGKSPSCGAGTRKHSVLQKYFSSAAMPITGVTAALLLREGYQIEEIK